MKKKSVIFATTALFILPVASVFAVEDEGMSGAVELGVQLSADEDEGAKFQEYQDLESSAYGGFLFDYYRDSFFFGAEGGNIGLDDQFLRINGGFYQNYSYSLFYDEIPHNLSFGARSFYSGLGSDRLIIDAATPSDVTTWRGFDYTTDLKKYGADIELFKDSPYFLNVDVNRQEQDGVRPLGSGSFSGVVEMPEPVDYSTNNFTVSGGYRADMLTVSLSGLYSTFSNGNQALHWDNPFLGITETNSLPQDNDFGKLGASLTWRQLPMLSTFVLRGSYTDLSSDLSIFELGTSVPEGLNTTSFDGDITTTRVSSALSSRPLDRLDTRLFYNYFDRDNDSTIVVYDEGSNATHLFDYSKHTAGAEADYKLPLASKLSGGYTFEDVDRRNRPDGSSSTDNLFFVKLANSAMELVTAGIEYSYLNRDTDRDFNALTAPSIYDAAYIRQFIQRFDVVSKSRHAVKLGFEFFPLDSLDLGASYTFATNDYDDVVLGRTEDTGHEFYVDANWRAAKYLTLSGFAGFEDYENDSNHYAFFAGAGTPPQAADPTFDDGNPDSFRWAQFVEEDFWTVGAAADVPLMRERLVLTLSAQYQESDGISDFTSEGPALQSIVEYEDFYITTLEAKAKYTVTEAIALTVGYFFEKTDYDDRQFEGYTYTPRGTYLTGAYADYDYDAHVGYVTMRYSF